MAVARAAGLRRLTELVQDEARQKREVNVFAGIEWQRSRWGFAGFARGQLKVVDKRGKLVPLVLNRTQRDIWRQELVARRSRRKPWFIILKSRKRGVTTLEQAIAYHTICSEAHADCVTMAHRPDDTRAIFRMTSRFYENQLDDRRHRKTEASVHHLEFPGQDSFYKAETASSRDPGRGSTFARIHMSEAGHYKHLRTLHTALVDAQRHDCAYVIESTANGRSGHGRVFYEFWQAASNGQSAFIPLFYPWFTDLENWLELFEPDEMANMSDEEYDLVDTYGLVPEQIKWWREKKAELSASGRAANTINQEHPHSPESAFLSSGESYYDAQLIEACYQGCRSPLAPSDLKLDYGPRMSEIEDGRFRIFEEPQPGCRYVIGADPAEGVGRDGTALVGVNSKTGEQAFSWMRNDMPPDVVGKDVVGHKVFGLGWIWKTSRETPAYVIGERQNHGHAFHTGLIKMAKYPLTAIHHDVDQLHDEEQRSRRVGWHHKHMELQWAVASTLHEGWPKVRDRLVVDSIQHVSVNGEKAEFTGRDLAVALGLCTIGLKYLPPPPSRFGFVGGRVIDFEDLKIVEPPSKESETETVESVEE